MRDGETGTTKTRLLSVRATVHKFKTETDYIIAVFLLCYTPKLQDFSATPYFFSLNIFVTWLYPNLEKNSRALLIDEQHKNPDTMSHAPTNAC